MKYLISIFLLSSFEAFACTKDEAFGKLDAYSVGYAKVYRAVAKVQNLRIESSEHYEESYDFWTSGSILKKLGTMTLTTTKDCQYFTSDFIPVE